MSLYNGVKGSAAKLWATWQHVVKRLTKPNYYWG